MKARRFSLLTTAFALLMSVSIVMAQAGGTCSALVAQALQALQNNCGSTPRNGACYGFNNVEAGLMPGVANVQFSQPADITDLANISSIRTRAFSEASSEWGIAVLKVQANIPDALPGQAVTLLLMGDVAVENAASGTQTPMQAIRLTTGLDSPSCQTLPPSTLTVQSPRGFTVDLSVNGANINLGSSAVIRSSDTDRLRLTTTDGRARFANGEQVPIGYGVDASLDASGNLLAETIAQPSIITRQELHDLQRLYYVPNAVMSYASRIPTEREMAMIAAMEDDWLDLLDMTLLRGVLNVLSGIGYLPEDLEGASIDDLAYVVEVELYETYPRLADAFINNVIALYDELSAIDITEEGDVSYIDLVEDYGYDTNFDNDIYDDEYFEDFFEFYEDEEEDVFWDEDWLDDYELFDEYEDGEFEDDGEFVDDGEFEDDGEFVDDGEYEDDGEFIDDGEFEDDGEFVDDGGSDEESFDEGE